MISLIKKKKMFTKFSLFDKLVFFPFFETATMRGREIGTQKVLWRRSRYSVEEHGTNAVFKADIGRRNVKENNKSEFED